MDGIIRLITSFIIFFLLRLYQYKKENGLLFIFAHSYLDIIILIGPFSIILSLVLNILNIEMKGVIVFLYFFLYIITIITYLFMKKLYFNKKKIKIGIWFPYADIFFIFICINLQWIILNILYWY